MSGHIFFKCGNRSFDSLLQYFLCLQQLANSYPATIEVIQVILASLLQVILFLIILLFHSPGYVLELIRESWIHLNPLMNFGF
ncbi:hypothetical protein PbDSM24746_19920 [Paenibacillus macerans]|nr:hypothetical protein PbDSM24746_19920 [Paenibacillus macerans]GBK68296.1 hypothetical protein PbJCM17693_20040 [Paenibacillus macerans]GIP12493.1 hypothetical protein J1TS5_46630 [Paenibacillus macerans]